MELGSAPLDIKLEVPTLTATSKDMTVRLPLDPAAQISQ
jgi:hypothetical protein